MFHSTYLENSDASPQGGAETYRWNVVPPLTRNKLLPLLVDCSRIQSLSPALKADTSLYRYLQNMHIYFYHASTCRVQYCYTNSVRMSVQCQYSI